MLGLIAQRLWRGRNNRARRKVRRYRRGLRYETFEQRTMMDAALLVDLSGDVAPGVADGEPAVAISAREQADAECYAPSWHNPAEPCDVNGDALVSRDDALLLISYLDNPMYSDPSSRLPSEPPGGDHPYLGLIPNRGTASS